jgi:hypothetical protein
MTKRQLIGHPTDPGIVMVPLTRGLFAMISVMDAEAVGQRTWRAVKDSKTFYAATSFRVDGKKQYLLLHRLIGDRMGIDVDCKVDHESRNGLDCRRENLRSADDAQSAWNRSVETGTITGVKGVTPRPGGDFEARVTVRGRRMFLGTYRTVEEAAAVVRAARRTAHGNFACDA